MPGFKVTATALRDIAEIITYLHREVSASIADRTEDQLFRSFHDLASAPALGHRRYDLTSKKLLFHPSPPYVVLFRRIKGTPQILRVLHGARDLTKLL